jgi:hypothetical protein
MFSKLLSMNRNSSEKNWILFTSRSRW